jgi:DNA polymerase-3 subunit gamma/tau
MASDNKNMTLAVKYRPKNFAEVEGQPTIISILSKQIETNTFRQAYLFVGPSGCGKTTTARIMANAINNNEGEPIEIDAASNNGVDSIRQLIVDAQQTSIDSDYKIYIIDETHMLTTAAWNAALKLIEEPPTNTIFIFCTTNPEKIPNTILSRVQRFDFKRISTKQIADRLEFILNEELIANYEKDALLKIANKANGFMREAISLLDKCIGYSSDVTLNNVEIALGMVKDETLFELTKNILNKDTVKAMDILNKLKAEESNLVNVIDDFLKFLIDAAKLQKTQVVYYGGISERYKDYFVGLNEDLVPLVDRVLKYRELSINMDADSLLSIIVLELCGR